jgi:hypothetical protein
MNLAQLRAEVLAHGFDPVLFPSSRIDTYINDAYMDFVVSVHYYTDEASLPIQTAVGVTQIAWPADLGDARSLVDTDRQRELHQVSLADLDSAQTVQGTPVLYAVNGPGFELYPAPDGIHNLLLRYWRLPPRLVVDFDVPTIPDEYHRLLWYWGCKEAYASEDDAQTAQYWEAQYKEQMAAAVGTVKFPTEFPTQVKSMWAVW